MIRDQFILSEKFWKILENVFIHIRKKNQMKRCKQPAYLSLAIVLD